MFTANSSKKAQGFCQFKKYTICYKLPLHTHDEDHFHRPKFLKLACGTYTKWILYRDKKNITKFNQKLLKPYYKDKMFNSK